MEEFLGAACQLVGCGPGLHNLSVLQSPPQCLRSELLILSQGHVDAHAHQIADVCLRDTGPAPTPRGFQAFGQPNPAARNLPLGSGRLQNTNKLGTWSPNILMDRVDLCCYQAMERLGV